MQPRIKISLYNADFCIIVFCCKLAISANLLNIFNSYKCPSLLTPTRQVSRRLLMNRLHSLTRLRI